MRLRECERDREGYREGGRARKKGGERRETYLQRESRRGTEREGGRRKDRAEKRLSDRLR